ncbi:MAG: hypothetical protein HY597_06995, partial [Candidatus Omnitrophica bacterium]|nr:hypothetical protein [Candidatus Omnitrophota bacterium]
MRAWGAKILSALLTVSLAAPWPMVVEATQASDARTAGVSSVRPAIRGADLFVPAEYGRIVDIVEPAGQQPAISNQQSASSQPLLIQIQDAHTNFSAQKNIAALLEHLVKSYRLKLIFLEGGEGDVSMADLRAAPLAKRKTVAAEFLRDGKITGAEYFEIATDGPTILWGAESKPLYKENVQAYLAAEQARVKIDGTLKKLRGLVDELAPRASNANLRALREAAGRFAQDQDLVAYAKMLANAAKAQALPPGSYPNLSRLLLTTEQEQTLSAQQAQAEEAKLLERLTKVAHPWERHSVESRRQQFAAGQLTAGAYYASLEQLAKQSRVDLTKYPSLNRYIQFAKLQDRLRIQELLDEADALSRELRTRLATTAVERRWVAIEEQLILLERLASLELTPQEYVRYQSLTSHLTPLTSWHAFLKDQITSLKGRATPVSASALEALSATVPTFERYYDLALQRDQEIRSRVLAKLDETGEPLAVLITGGFHTRHLTQLFREAGLPSVIVTPKITQATDKARYAAILKYKQGLTDRLPASTAAASRLQEGASEAGRVHDELRGRLDIPPAAPATSPSAYARLSDADRVLIDRVAAHVADTYAQTVLLTRDWSTRDQEHRQLSQAEYQRYVQEENSQRREGRVRRVQDQAQAILAQVYLGELAPDAAVARLESLNIDRPLAEAYVRQASEPTAMAGSRRGTPAGAGDASAVSVEALVQQITTDIEPAIAAIRRQYPKLRPDVPVRLTRLLYYDPTTGAILHLLPERLGLSKEQGLAVETLTQQLIRDRIPVVSLVATGQPDGTIDVVVYGSLGAVPQPLLAEALKRLRHYTPTASGAATTRADDILSGAYPDTFEWSAKLRDRLAGSYDRLRSGEQAWIDRQTTQALTTSIKANPEAHRTAVRDLLAAVRQGQLTGDAATLELLREYGVRSDVAQTAVREASKVINMVASDDASTPPTSRRGTPPDSDDGGIARLQPVTGLLPGQGVTAQGRPSTTQVSRTPSESSPSIARPDGAMRPVKLLPEILPGDEGYVRIDPAGLPGHGVTPEGGASASPTPQKPLNNPGPAAPSSPRNGLLLRFVAEGASAHQDGRDIKVTFAARGRSHTLTIAYDDTGEQITGVRLQPSAGRRGGVTENLILYDGTPVRAVLILYDGTPVRAVQDVAIVPATQERPATVRLVASASSALRLQRSLNDIKTQLGVRGLAGEVVAGQDISPSFIGKMKLPALEKNFLNHGTVDRAFLQTLLPLDGAIRVQKLLERGVSPSVLRDVQGGKFVEVDGQAKVSEEVARAFPKLFGTKTVNGRPLNVLQVIADLTRELGPEVANALEARRRLLESPAPVREKYAFPKWGETFPDAFGNVRTFSQIVLGQIHNFLGIDSEWSWRLNDDVPIPDDAFQLKNPGLELTGPWAPLDMALKQINADVAATMGPDDEDAAPPNYVPAGAPAGQPVGLFVSRENERRLLAGEVSESTVTKKGQKVTYRAEKPLSQRPASFHRVPSLHLLDSHVTVDGKPAPAMLVDYVMHALNNFGSLQQIGKKLYVYQPKIQHPSEALIVAKLAWKLEQLMGATQPGQFIKMKLLYEEGRAGLYLPVIMWVLRPWLMGTNVGRWDYTGALIEMWKGERVLPDPQNGRLMGMISTHMIGYQRVNALWNVMAGMKDGKLTNGAPIGGMAAVMLYPPTDPYGRHRYNPVALRGMRNDKMRERLLGLMFVPAEPLPKDAQPTLQEILAGRIKGRFIDAYRQSWVATPDKDYVAAGNGPLRAQVEELQAMLDAAEAYTAVDGERMAPTVTSGLTEAERAQLQNLGLLNEQGQITPWVLPKAALESPEALFSSKELWGGKNLWDALYDIPKGEITI